MVGKTKKKFRWWQIVLIVIGAIVAVIVAAAIVLVAVLTITEYKPADVEDVEISSSDSAVAEIESGDEFTVMSWNTGFAAQGADSDCFLDGGTSVVPTDKAGVETNMNAIAQTVSEYDPDIVLFQEVDTNSKRSHYIDQHAFYQEQFTEYSSSFALNYSTLYVPYPFPVTLGKVNAGLSTFSKYDPDTSTRISLPCAFSWPMSTVNLKRCLLVDRIKVEGSDKELVVVNLHLEAYDDGEGKIAQTKQLCEFLQTEYEKGNYVIAGGDFNQIFSNCDNSAYPVLAEKWQPGEVDTTEFGNNFTCIMDNSVPTCRSLDKAYTGANQDPSEFQYYMIDGFIVSDNLTINEMKTIDKDFANSDHNPIMIDVTLE